MSVKSRIAKLEAQKAKYSRKWKAEIIKAGILDKDFNTDNDMIMFSQKYYGQFHKTFLELRRLYDSRDNLDPMVKELNLEI